MKGRSPSCEFCCEDPEMAREIVREGEINYNSTQNCVTDNEVLES